MKLVDIVIWTVAIVVCLIAYVGVATAAFVIWEPICEVLFGLLLTPLLAPFVAPGETWLIIKVLRSRPLERLAAFLT
jgi:hypothetical protein